MAASLDTTPDKFDPFNRIDMLNAQLGELQTALLAEYAEANRKHQLIDAEHAPTVNGLLKSAQEAFDELKRLSEAHRVELLPRGKKSTRRNTGTVGWRSVPRLLVHIDEDELIKRIRLLGQRVYRRFVRRTTTLTLNRDAMTALGNRALLAQIDGVELDLRDDFFATPSGGGIRMSSNKPWWPRLEGLTAPLALNTMLEDHAS